MIEKLFQKLLDKAYPNRKIKAVKIGKKFFRVTNDVFGSLEFSLKGAYSYDQVELLNSFIGGSTYYGFCPDKGPIAIIGIMNAKSSAHKKYFREVGAYGELPSDKEFELHKYSTETAKKIINYTVYGVIGMEKITHLVQFDKITTVCDARYKDVYRSHEYRILKMKAKLEGTYTFHQAQNLAYNQQRWAVDRGMAYATLENGEHVAIMSFWYSKKDEVSGFRDVWETGEPEPATQSITFMTDEEAKRIRDFSIYLYDYDFFCVPTKGPAIAKLDRTLSPSFDFYDTPDGKDLRLSEKYF